MKTNKMELAERYDMFFRSARALVMPKNTYIELGSSPSVRIGDDNGTRYVEVQGGEGWERIYIDDEMFLNDFGETLKRKGVVGNLFKFLENNKMVVYSLYNHRGDEKGLTFLLNSLRRNGERYRLVVDGTDRAYLPLKELKELISYDPKGYAPAMTGALGRAVFSMADKVDDLLRSAGSFIKAFFGRVEKKPADYRASYDAERFVEKHYGMSL
ncbi:MAG: hypothetical protein QXU09_04120 [Thermoproteota archaeon]